MTLGRLLLRNLGFYWKGNLAVLAGVALGTAVLTGALLVGDSLRGSLRDLVLEQLGEVRMALVGGRFVRAELANGLAIGPVSPAVILQGSASFVGPDRRVHRAGRVMIYGVNGQFWQGSPPIGADFWEDATDGLVINSALAKELNVSAGSTVTLHLQKPTLVPRETLLGKRDAGEILDDLSLKVSAVIPATGLGRFSLQPSPAVARNAFLPLPLLQAKLKQKDRVNALLAGNSPPDIQDRLQQILTLDDWGLVLHTPESRTEELFAKLDRNHDGKLTPNEYRRRLAESFVRAADRDHDHVLDRDEVLAYYRAQHCYASLEARQMLLEPAIAKAALSAAREVGLKSAPTLVYLANSISDGAHAIPYSVVAALDPGAPPDLGPFVPAGVERLADDEIVLADWKESPLTARLGDTITLTYYQPELEGKLNEVSTPFRLRGKLSLAGAVDDPDLTPEFPGITDKLDLRDWNPPFPYDNKRVGPADEHFWEEYRTTPKAFINLSGGQKLWGSRFGNLTSIRLALPNATGDKAAQLQQAADSFTKQLLAKLRPEEGGLVFEPVRERGLQGSTGSSPFGWLFLGFSSFLIVAALLLVGLLFRLNLDQRAGESGLLFGLGYSAQTVRRLYLFEGMILAALGGLIGLAGSALYAWLMLSFLAAAWPGGIDQALLNLHVSGASMAIGFISALVMSIVTIIWAVRVLGRVAPRALLYGNTTDEGSGERPKGPRLSRWLAAIAAVGGIACLAAGPFMRGGEEQASTFFSSGALLLTAGLACTWIWMARSRLGAAGQGRRPTLTGLAIRNAARHATRSLLTAGLLASATFVIVAVASFHRSPEQDFLDLHAGSGGFSLLAESDVPLFQNLNNDKGRNELNFSAPVRAALNDVSIYGLRLRQGEDASCLNLYQPRKPRLLGVPAAVVNRNAFHFQAIESSSAEGITNPWLLLEQPRSDGAIPVFGEANTVKWILQSDLGKEIEVANENGEPVRCRFVGLLEDSVFQSEVLLSEANFLNLFPRQEGYSFFLIQAPGARAQEVREALETALADFGFTVTPAAQRLAAYLAVENMYLTTFQALGGLGLLLGALGLAVVLVRGVWERRGELALLRALGFRASALKRLILIENAFLLVLGLGIGAGSALVSVAPHLLGRENEIPWVRMLQFLFLVLVVGLVAGAIAVSRTLRVPLLPALRRE
jgi:putative ABC transport system permease protein